MPTVELFFDASSESRLRELWEQFASFGVPFMRDSGARPHITLLACDSVDVTAASANLDRFAALTSSFPISLASFGLFPKPLSVAFLAAKVTSDLLALHARFFTEFSALAAGCSSLYSPEQWIPHCTLAPDLPPQHLGLALDTCRSFGLPLSCVASEIGLVEYWPCRQLYAKCLVANRNA
jgi:2'-5' RNA ligase